LEILWVVLLNSIELLFGFQSLRILISEIEVFCLELALVYFLPFTYGTIFGKSKKTDYNLPFSCFYLFSQCLFAINTDTMSLFNLSETIIETEIPVLNDAEEKKMDQEQLPDELAILPLKNTVLFPGVVIPITIGRDKSIQLIKDAYAGKSRLIGVVAQKNMNIENPEPGDLFPLGTVANILKMLKMPDGSITAVIQGRSRFVVDQFTQEDPYLKAKVTKAADVFPEAASAKAMAISLRKEAMRVIELSPQLPTEANIALQNINSFRFLVNFISSHLNLSVQDKQGILETDNLLDRANKVLEFLGKELQVLELSEEIQSKVRTDLDKQQRDYILRQQIKAIQDELGEEGLEQEMDDLKGRAEKKQMSKQAKEVFDKELHRLQRLHPNSPEYAVSMNYLDWMLELPWYDYKKEEIDLAFARDVLDADHYGLEKVKDRILEYLAVLKLNGNLKAPILCFYGPPGVGKTSLGKSIAAALKRDFVRMSLGGVRDEAEIRGHRRTYIGAMPGRILQGLKKAKTGNPVFMLDEIDKVGNDFRGDPSSALLEVLDPAQNNAFNDHFLEVDYDLSSIMFIATANSLESIHPALRDRMELIEINGYTLEEKVQIAKQHLIPQQRDAHGLKSTQLKISPGAMKSLVESYTRESGVRNLNQKIARICRVAAKEIVANENEGAKVTEDNLSHYLGAARFDQDGWEKIEVPGVSIGLAWTQVGGDILYIESVLMPGTGKMTITGQLGEVMKESASAAFTYLKSIADKYSIPKEAFSQWDVHIHIPAGAVPKDGPSAGITLLTALTSLYTKRLVKSRLAMTGEITLRGKVLPVGGIKEKVLAAARAGIRQIIMCKENKKDVEEIKDEALKNLEFFYVERMEEVLTLALEGDRKKNKG
jgi:ATP-dependent Lon protease